MADEKVAILLGAGASVEAGLPISVGLTKKVAETIEADQWNRYEKTSLALNFAIGALIAHDSARGNSAFAGIDVERLFAAVQMLSDRDSLEIAPFVSAWNVALDGIRTEGKLPANFGRDLKRELFSNSPAGFQFNKMFSSAIESLIDSGASSDFIYAKLRDQMITVLRDCLALDGSTVDYLAPLLAGAGQPIQIATLNYDRSVELLCGRAGVELTTGVSLWSGGYDWDWEEGAGVQLLKLHGSIDWTIEKNRPVDGYLPRESIVIGEITTPLFNSRGTIGVVFGQREKLRSEGPFLAMLREFDQFLKDADRLVVVGYSFRDDHINSAIGRWFNSRPEPHVTLIDPALNGVEEMSHNQREIRFSKFLQDLLRAMQDPTIVGPRREVKPGHQLLGCGAGEGLKAVFGSGPDLLSVEELRSTLTQSPPVGG